MKGFLLSAALGFVALALVNLCGAYTGVLVPVNRLSLGAAGAAGRARCHPSHLAERHAVAPLAGKREDVANAADSRKVPG